MGNILKRSDSEAKESEAQAENQQIEEEESKVIMISDNNKELKNAERFKHNPNFNPKKSVKRYPKEKHVSLMKHKVKNYKTHKAPRQAGKLVNKRNQ